MTTFLGTTPLRPGDTGYEEGRAAWNLVTSTDAPSGATKETLDDEPSARRDLPRFWRTAWSPWPRMYCIA